MGWMRPYLCMADSMFTGRWLYWMRTINEGKVLDDPIPKIDWTGNRGKEAYKNLEQCIDFCRHTHSWNALDMFVEWLLFGFGDPMFREFPKSVPNDVNAHWYKTFNLGLFLEEPDDYLGSYAADIYSGGSNPTGYFPTPMHVSVMMAEMAMADDKDIKTKRVCDPCVGSGRLLLAASNYCLNLYGMDIDHRMINICKANMWIYAPWGALRPTNIEGLEDCSAIEQGDSLAMRVPVEKVAPEVQEKMMSKVTQMSLF